MTKISVIVPVYKVEPFIHRCVDSILGQSFRDFELILVDDGSPDSCGAICDEYAAKDSRVHVIHQENGGLSAARNAGIDWVFANSDSQWLAFIDSDDWIHKEYLQILLSAAEKLGAGIAACDMIRTADLILDAPLSAAEPQLLPAEQAYTAYYGMCMPAWRKIFAKGLFAQERFPVGKLHEDGYITHKLIFAAERIAICDVPMYYYYFNPQSITRRKWTPKRLEEIESHEQRLTWLQEQGFEKAYAMELEIYTITLYEHIEALMGEGNTQYADHRITLRRKLRTALKHTRAHGCMAFEMEYLWIYTMAYAGETAWLLLRWIRGLRDKVK